MKRRTFVRNTTLTAAAAISAPAVLKAKRFLEFTPNEKIASFDNDNIVIIIEMFGGNDGLNTIVPAYDDEYYKIRPQLAIPKNIAKQFQNTDIYLNPNLVTGIVNNGLMSLLETGRLAIVQGIGYVPSNLSHFRSQEIWYSGYNTSDPNERLLDGWLGRYIESKLPGFPTTIPQHPIAIQIGASLSMLLKAPNGDMGIALTDPDSFFNLGAGLTPVEGFRTVAGNYDSEFNFVRAIAEQSEVYSKEVKKAYDAGKSAVKINYSSGLSQQFKLISQLIAGGLKTKVYYVKLSNFDSHAQQQNADFVNGQHPTLIGQVARGISEFLDDAMKQGWADRVVGLTMSEFGRRAYENGSRGTDHGAGSVQLVFGNYVNAGYYGEKPDLTKLDEDGNINMQFDYRRTYTDFLQTWLGATSDDTTALFKQSFMPLGLLKSRQTSVENDIEIRNGSQVLVSPVPSQGNVNISFTLAKPGMADVSIYNEMGTVQQVVHAGFMEAGNYSYPVHIKLPGTYFCSVLINNRRYSSKIVII